MIEDLTVRGFAEKTPEDSDVRAFAGLIGRSPNTATAEDLRRFQLHQTQSGMQPPSINSAVSQKNLLSTGFSDPVPKFSTTAATPGAGSSISQSCPLACAIGRIGSDQWVFVFVPEPDLPFVGSPRSPIQLLSCSSVFVPFQSIGAIE